MTQYLLNVYHAGAGPDLTPEELKKSFADVDALNTKMMDAKVFVFAGGLHSADTSTVLRGTGGDVVITDGPYLETKEHVGGFWVIEAPDLDAALAWARQATIACRLPVELRPFQSMEDAPG